MDRKPVFDAIRRLFSRRLTQAQVTAIDAALDAALAGVRLAPHEQGALAQAAQRRLGSLSERYECGDRGPGAVSTGRNDPGGVSYGLYQLSSRTGTCAAFIAAEGRRWHARFAGLAPGSEAFSKIWQTIAGEEPDAFAEAQRAFIERTHYRPAAEAVKTATGFDLDRRPVAVCDAAWSTAVQHGGAARILIDATRQTLAKTREQDPDFDRRLIEAIYDVRSAYVLKVAERPRLGEGQRALLRSVVRNRFAAERRDALALLDR